MTITITLTIQAEPADLVALGTLLTASFTQATRSLAAAAPQLTSLHIAPTPLPTLPTEPVPASDEVPDEVEVPTEPIEPAAAPVAEPVRVVPAAKATPEPKRPALMGTPKAVKGKRTPTKVLPIDEYDQLVRSEMKRLSMDRRLPNRTLWDEERNPKLPTMKAVQDRYKCTTLDELAAIMGLEPPLPRYVRATHRSPVATAEGVPA